MDTSDTGSQSPPQAQLTQLGHPTLEEEMRAKAAAGELLDRGAGPFDLAAMQSWGEERAVSAVERAAKCPLCQMLTDYKYSMQVFRL